MQQGLKLTEKLWSAVREAYSWLHQAAHLLANEQQQDVISLKQEYEHLLSAMQEHQERLGELAPAVMHFCKVTASYWDGLFLCYQIEDLPRTNNDLEHYFGTARHLERRVTGRKHASPALVIRGSVRVVAAGVSRIRAITALELRLADEKAWRALRQQLEYRHESRRMQLRFRRDPDAYLALLELRLLTAGLPS